MSGKPSSPITQHSHVVVDIHQILPKETTVDPQIGDDGTSTPKKMRQNQPKKYRRNLSRQLSLEPAVAALDKESTGSKSSASHLPRSGRSVGHGARTGNDVHLQSGSPRKVDFSIFKTKSTINKQNPMLPSRRDFSIFRTKSINKQNSMLPVSRENEQELQKSNSSREKPINLEVTAGRYYAALRGPELDEVKDYEDILLPRDEKWPFLLRFPIGCFGICLGLSSQTVLWGAISSSPEFRFLRVPHLINILLWFLATITLILVFVTYSLKCIFYLEAIRREYYHPVRVNFFFAPWIACMYLAIAIPRSMAIDVHPALWCVFMAPVFLLELKIYGQWLSRGKRRLSKVANPSSHLAVVGNFVGAILAARVGWGECAKFFWAVGFAHYLVVFVTLYQRLPTSEAVPKELHPVYSMFIMSPAAASIAWKAIYGEFDNPARICYFTALFLYISLIVRINFFRGFRFSVAWWCYTFPMTTASIATIRYAEEVPCTMTKLLAITLSLLSSLMVSILTISTFLHAFVWQSLFPNDLAIAITKKRNNLPKTQVKEKKHSKKANGIRRWTKNSALSLVSSKKNTSAGGEDLDDEKKV